MRKILLSLLCCLMVVSALQVIAPAPGYSDEGTPVSVVRAYFATPTLLFLAQGEDALSLESSMEAEIIAQYGRFGFLKGLDATWDYSSFDSTKTGRQSIEGIVNLPSGYAYYENGEEAPLVIEQEVWVYLQGMPESESVTLYNAPTIASTAPIIPLGSSSAEIEQLVNPFFTGVVLFRTVDGLIFSFNATFDTALIDSGAAGIYYPFRASLPDGIEVIEDVGFREHMALTVNDPTTIDLSGVMPSTRGSYTLAGSWLCVVQEPYVWITQSSPFEEGSNPVWSLMDESPTRGLESQEIELGDTTIAAEITTDSQGSCMTMQLEFDNPPENGEYWIKITHADGESNILQVVIDHETMTASLPRGGDRIGDNGGNGSLPENNESPGGSSGSTSSGSTPSGSLGSTSQGSSGSTSSGSTPGSSSDNTFSGNTPNSSQGSASSGSANSGDSAPPLASSLAEQTPSSASVDLMNIAPFVLVAALALGGIGAYQMFNWRRLKREKSE